VTVLQTKMNRGLQLEFSMGGRDNDTLEATYRNEGLSVGADHMVRFVSFCVWSAV
jgi:hypothetical protein